MITSDRPRSPYEGLTSPQRQPPTRSAKSQRLFSLGKSLAFRDSRPWERISDRLLHVPFIRIYDVSNYIYGNDETKFWKKLHPVPRGVRAEC